MGVDRRRLNRVEIQLTSVEEPIVVSWDTRDPFLSGSRRARTTSVTRSELSDAATGVRISLTLRA
jgi:hypothetical protein